MQTVFPVDMFVHLLHAAHLYDLIFTISLTNKNILINSFCYAFSGLLTMLLFLTVSALVLSVAAQREVTNILTVTNGANAGTYFKDEFCPAGTFAAGFQLLVSYNNQWISKY